MTYDTDILIIGGGPTGLALACRLAQLGVHSIVCEQSEAIAWQAPVADGREIALTHQSVDILERLGVWSHINSSSVSPLVSAKVLNGDIPFALDFSSNQSNTPLGYLVSNHHIRQAAYIEAQRSPLIQLRPNTKIVRTYTDAQAGRVALAEGTTLSAKLVIAADSRFSTSRQQMGIPTDLLDFGRSVILARVQHTQSHRAVAYESFGYNATLALLPLAGEDGCLSSAVITLPTNQAHTILNFSPTDFAQYVQKESKGRLGEIELLSERHIYPLIATYAQRFYAQRFALVGDAAVGMHPVTAHGYNFGLYSIQTLGDLIKQACQQHQDIGNLNLLKTYSQIHRQKTWAIYQGTNALVKLFTNNHLPAKIIRHGVLRMANQLPMIKNWVTKQLMNKPLELRKTASAPNPVNITR